MTLRDAPAWGARGRSAGWRVGGAARRPIGRSGVGLGKRSGGKTTAQRGGLRGHAGAGRGEPDRERQGVAAGSSWGEGCALTAGTPCVGARRGLDTTHLLEKRSRFDGGRLRIGDETARGGEDRTSAGGVSLGNGGQKQTSGTRGEGRCGWSGARGDGSSGARPEVRHSGGRGWRGRGTRRETHGGHDAASRQGALGGRAPAWGGG